MRQEISTFRSSIVTTSTVTFVIAAILAPSVCLAKDDIFIVSHHEAIFHIPIADLLANDGQRPTFGQFNQTSRGTLQRVGPVLEYHPDPVAFTRGQMDSFSYEDPQTGSRSVVFLVLDELNTQPIFSSELEVEVGDESQTLIIKSGVLTPESTSTSVKPTEIRLASELATNSSFLEVRLPISAANRPTTEECTQIEICPNGFDLSIGDEALIATALSDTVKTFELILARGATGHFLKARVWRQDDTVAELISDGISDDHMLIGFRWWEQSGIGDALDGGLILYANNRIVASTTGLGQGKVADPDQLDLRFGAMNISTSGTLHALNPSFGINAGNKSVLTPLFADGAESGDTTAWDGVVGSVTTPTQAAVLGSRGFNTPTAFASYLVDESPTVERHYRARFNVDLNRISLADGYRMTLFQALSTTGGSEVAPFALDLTRANGQLELCAKVKTSPLSLPVDVGCTAITNLGATSVEAKWWAAPDPSQTGGLIVKLRDASLTGSTTWVVDNRTLTNAGQAIEEVRFGVVQPSAGAIGSIYFDDFESWR